MLILPSGRFLSCVHLIVAVKFQNQGLVIIFTMFFLLEINKGNWGSFFRIWAA